MKILKYAKILIRQRSKLNKQIHRINVPCYLMFVF